MTGSSMHSEALTGAPGLFKTRVQSSTKHFGLSDSALTYSELFSKAKRKTVQVKREAVFSFLVFA